MGQVLEGGSSFMEDYTYDINNGRSVVLGSHMFEICPTIASSTPRCEIHPLEIGSREDPTRLVFEVAPGLATNISLIDLGTRFVLVSEVEIVNAEQPLPKLPVARVPWNSLPDFATSAKAWIMAGGAHHTVFTKAITTSYIEDFADIAGVELTTIDNNLNLNDLKNQLNWNEVYYTLFDRHR